MGQPQSYKQITQELSEQLSKAESRVLLDILERAVQLTDISRNNLDALEDQRMVFLAGIETHPPQSVEKIRTAVDYIAEQEALEALLREELHLAEQESEKTVETREIDISMDNISPEFRDLLREMKEPKQKRWSRDPEDIRREIADIQKLKRSTAELAISSTELTGLALSSTKLLYVIGNLWLTHMLVNQIYDTTDTDFNTSLKDEMKSEGISWTVGKVLGILPIVGIAADAFELVKKLAGMRSKRWADTDKTLRFLEEYSKALSAWNGQFRSHHDRAAELIAQIST
jgi:hypothetical protein